MTIARIERIVAAMPSAMLTATFPDPAAGGTETLDHVVQVVDGRDLVGEELDQPEDQQRANHATHAAA